MTSRAFRTLFASLGLLAVSAACTDLGVEPKSTVTSGNAFNDQKSYVQFLAKLYGGLQMTGQQGNAGAKDIESISDEGFSGYLRLYWNMQELPTEEAVIGWGDGSLQELNTQKWSTSNEFVSGMWARVFFQVGLANEFLRQSTDEMLDFRNQNDPEFRATIATYRAEARFLRALAYYHGLDLFGNVPIVEEDFVLGGAGPEQSSRAQVFEFVESELLAIRDQLPPSGRGQYYGRASVAAADMLLAHLYLNAEVYTGAARYSDARMAAERVIGSAFYQLDDDWQDIFLADNHTSPEIIFPIPSDGKRQQSYGGMTTIIHASVGGNMNSNDYGLNGGWWGLRVRPEFVALFGDNDTDDARSHPLVGEELGQNLDIASLGDFFAGYGGPKFRNVTSAGTDGSDREFVDTDFPLFRLADAYLIYAEAFVRGGGGTEALAVQYVNDLRERAYGDASGNIDGSDLTEAFILAERGRELYWEAKRRTDLIRFGLFSDAGVWQWKGAVAAGTTTEPWRDLYPIPAQQLNANSKLSQNEGYD
jgi:hypothetical protein